MMARMQMLRQDFECNGRSRFFDDQLHTFILNPILYINIYVCDESCLFSVY